MEEMEHALHKYEGVPHEGKNQFHTFQQAARRMVNVGYFSKVKSFDPYRFFSSFSLVCDQMEFWEWESMEE